MKLLLTLDQANVLKMVLDEMRIFKISKSEAIQLASEINGVSEEWIRNIFKDLSQ